MLSYFLAMSTNLEIESKAMLSKSDYEKLMESFPHIDSYTQINYYISSKELLSKVSKYGMRIRKKNKAFELTLKDKNNDEIIEINQEIPRKSYVFLKYFHKFPDGDVKDYLTINMIGDPSKLKIIGKMKTIRKDIKLQSSLISIDKSIYNHHVDYEIECEDKTPIAAKTNLQIFLAQHEIVYKKSELSKLARFLQTK